MYKKMKNSTIFIVLCVFVYGLFFKDVLACSEGGCNLALNKLAYDDGHEGCLTPDKAFDGNTSTRWGSDFTDNEYIYVDLADTFWVHSVVLRWEAAYGKEYKIQVSNDASTWSDAAHIENGVYETKTITFPAKAARYVKMLGIERGTCNGYSLWEFEVCGDTIQEYVHDEPEISFPLSSYAVYSTEKTTVLSNVTELYGSIGSNTFVEVCQNAIVSGYVTSYENVFLMYNSTVDKDVIAKGEIDKEQSVEIIGSEIENADIGPLYFPENTFDIGIADVNISNDETYILNPGNYRDLMALSRSTIQMSSGTYAFKTFRTEPEVTLQFNILPGEILKINVLDNFDLRDSTIMVLENGKYPLSVQIYSKQQCKMNLHPHTEIYGIITAPNAEIHVHPASQVHGSLYGKKVTLEPGVLICKPPVLYDILHSEWAFSPAFNEFNLKYSTTVPDVTSTLLTTPISDDETISITVNGKSPYFPIVLDENPKEILIELLKNECLSKSQYQFDVTRDGNYVIYVNDDSPCNSELCDGTSWGSAYKDLQLALDDAAENGKEIWVAEGSYTPSKKIMDTDVRSATFLVNSGMEIIGGFNTTESDRFPKGSPYKTILSGDIDDNDDSLSAWPPDETDTSYIDDNVYHVLTIDAKKHTKSIKITGFSISGGFADGNGSNGIGAGVYNIRSRPYLEMCGFRKNYSLSDGAGMYSGNAPQLIKNCYFNDNVSKSGNGAGLFVKSMDTLVIEASIFDGNNAKDIIESRGGGLYVWESPVKIFNSIFIGNHAALDGGALYANDAELSVTNATITHNSSSLFSGGISNTSSNALTSISNTILWQNTGGDSLVGKDGVLNDLMASNFQVTHSDVTYPIPDVGNITGDPLFVNTTNPQGANGYYGDEDDGLQLTASSPCKDAGEISSATQEDILLIRRPYGPQADIGAYEYEDYHEQNEIFGDLYFGGGTPEFVYKSDIQIIDMLHNPVYIRMYAFSNVSRVIRIKVPKNEYTADNTTMFGYLRSVDGDGNPVPDYDEVYIELIRVSDEGSFYYYQSKTEDWGKWIIFIKTPYGQNTSNRWAYIVRASADYEFSFRVPHYQFD